MPARIVLGDHLRSRVGELLHVPVHSRAECNCIVYSEAVTVLVKVKKGLVTLLTVKCNFDNMDQTAFILNFLVQCFQAYTWT